MRNGSRQRVTGVRVHRCPSKRFAAAETTIFAFNIGPMELLILGGMCCMGVTAIVVVVVVVVVATKKPRND